jgi:RES domain
MLETLPRVHLTQDVNRFANLSHIGLLAVKKGLTIDEVREVIAFNHDDVKRDLMKAPFQRKRYYGNKFGPVSRFSDGEWPVFYAAIGRKTAEKESSHHYGRKAAGDAAARRPVHYSIVRCRFSGETVDLQPQLPDWPNLISNDYTFCNGLGREAHDSGLGGFFAPSARDNGGTTVPAFIEETLFGAVIEATATLTFDGGQASVEIKELP